MFSCARIITQLNAKATTAVVHSITSIGQQIEAMAIPFVTTSILIGLGIKSLEPLSSYHLQLEKPFSAIGATALPIAANIDALLRIGVGLSKILFHIQNNFPNKYVAKVGVWELMSGISSLSIAMYALSTKNMPIACLAFAVANYCDSITKMIECLSLQPNILNNTFEIIIEPVIKLFEATGWLSFVINNPVLACVLLGLSTLGKIYNNPAQRTGSIESNICQDYGRFMKWYQHEEQNPNENEMANAHTIARRVLL